MAVNATIKIRYNYTSKHLDAASFFLTELREMEKDANEYTLTPARFEYYWRSAIISIGCALESYIYDLLNGFVEGAYNDENATQKEELAKLLERRPMFEKYDFLYLHKTGRRINKGTTEYRDAQLTIKLRNEIVHFKTHWFHEPTTSEKLESNLRSKFETNQFKCVESLFFPDLCTSASCVEWALKSVENFIYWYSKSVGGPCPIKRI
ncbi:TPA: hypothetical protein I7792_20400 [Vibrio vulnificus]|nr:hypothetical protein [Vibrio vulnificus]